MNVEIFFTPLRLGALALPNRLVMPGLTRMRCDSAGVPQPIAAEYYCPRASAGLVWPTFT